MAIDTERSTVVKTYQTRIAHIQNHLQKWFLFSFTLGILTGLAVAGVHVIIYDGIWSHVSGLIGTHARAYIFPVVGIVAAAILVNKYSTNPGIHSTEEVIQSYNENGGRIHLASFPAKVIASILTIGFGGSAGMEGPSIYIGAAIASWFR